MLEVERSPVEEKWKTVEEKCSPVEEKWKTVEEKCSPVEEQWPPVEENPENYRVLYLNRPSRS